MSCLAAAGPCAPASEELAVAEGEFDAVVAGDEGEEVTDPERAAIWSRNLINTPIRKQRKVAAGLEHQLAHDPKCYMCEVCLRFKTQRRRKRKRV